MCTSEFYGFKKEQVRKKKRVSTRERVNKGDQEEDFDPRQYHENRLQVLAAFNGSGVNPYPHKFHVSLSIPAFIDKYGGLSSGEYLNDAEVSLAGRILSKRSSGAKLKFYDLNADRAKVQVMADASSSGMGGAEFVKHHAGIKRCDIVGIRGYQGKSKRGELSIFPTSMMVLSPCLHMLPVKDDHVRTKESEGDDMLGIWAPGCPRHPERYTLKDPETRYRQHYLDLKFNSEVRNIFKITSKIQSYVWQFLEDLDFLEVGHR